MTDETLDLTISRVMKATREQIWKAWTDPAILAEWWCPRPWTVRDVKLDMRPGGGFSMVMVGPNGEEMPQSGCILHVAPRESVVFTDYLTAGWRPAQAEPFMTAIIAMEDGAEGVRYSAVVKHKNDEDKKKHEEMGFHEGWGAVMAQLDEIASTL